MTGVARQLIKHRLNEKTGSKPIRQKKRGRSKERNKAIDDEVEKLVKVGIVEESLFPSWVANPILVKKGNGK